MARFSTGAPIVATGRRQRCKKTIIGCLAVLALILLAYCAASNQTGIQGLSGYAYTELESGVIYQADDLTVVSRLAANTHEVNDAAKNVADYYLAFFHDRNDCLVAAILSVDDSDDIYARLSDDMMDENRNIGDCLVNGYVKTGSSLTSVSNELKKYYHEALDSYGPVLGEYSASLEYMLVYYCNGYSDPLIQFLENRYETAAGS